MRWFSKSLGRLRGVLMAAVCAAISAQALTAGAAELRLTHALVQAHACGPAFREHARQMEALRIAVETEKNRFRPQWQITAGAQMAPTATATASARMDWRVTDSLSLDVNLPIGARQGSTLPGTTRQGVEMGWSKVLWPEDDTELGAEIHALEERIAQIEVDETYHAAVAEVIRAFMDAKVTGARVEVAARTVELATARAEDALDRYQRGLIALRTLQSEQNALHQATSSLQRALVEADRAFAQLQRVLGPSTCTGIEVDELLELVDDIDWRHLEEQIAQSLELPWPDLVGEPSSARLPELSVQAWSERLLNNSVVYQRAVLGLLTAERGVAQAEGEREPMIAARASAGTELQGERVVWSVGINVSWEFTPNVELEITRARIQLEAAEDRLAQAQETTLEAGRSAWSEVLDALSGLELAQRAVDEALATERLVVKRIEAGLAPAVEAEEALVEVHRRLVDLQAAENQVRLAWLSLARRFNLALSVSGG